MKDGAAVQAAFALRLYRVRDHLFARVRKADHVLHSGIPPETHAQWRPRPAPARPPSPSSTCERRTLPDEQAEPDDSATPSRSKAISAVSALSARNREGQRVRQPRGPGREDHRSGATGLQRRPRLRRAARASRADSCHRALRRRSGRGAEAGDRRDVLGPGPPAPLLSAAAHEPVGHSTGPARGRWRPTPFGPPSLCAERVSASTPSAARSTGSLPAACTASRVDKPAARVDEPGRLGDGLDRRRSRCWRA